MKKIVSPGYNSYHSIHANARIWRVNNNAGVVADFTTVAAAVTAAAAGDTIYIEGSATAYGGSGLNKKLTFIGTGYFWEVLTVMQVCRLIQMKPISVIWIWIRLHPVLYF